MDYLGPLLILLFLAWAGWRFLARRGRPAATEPSVSPALTGQQAHWLDVAGVHHHEAALELAFGPQLKQARQDADIDPADLDSDQTYGVETVEAAAELLLDDENPHDGLAVAVHIGGQLVGYVPRSLAPYFRRHVGAAHPGARVFRCLAEVDLPLAAGDDWAVRLDLPPLKSAQTA